MRRKAWKFSEREVLIKNYKNSTIQELMRMFPDRTADSINAEIKRLKASGKLEGYKEPEVVSRSLKQR